MKNTIRVRHDNGANRSPAQAQPTPAKKSAKPKSGWSRRYKLPSELLPVEGSRHSTCLASFCRNQGKAFNRIPITDDEFCQLIIEANKQNIYPVDFIAETLRKRLSAKTLFLAIDELENTTLKVNALLQLLADKFSDLNDQKGCDFTGEECRHFFNGVQLLVMDAQDRLATNFQAIFHAAHSKPEVAS